MEPIRNILRLFNKKDRFIFLSLVAGILLTGFFEVASIASVMPFMALVLSPEIIHSNAWVSLVYQKLGFTQDRDFLLFVGGGVFFLIVFGNGFSAWINWLVTRFGYHQGHVLSEKLFQKYLTKPYEFYLSTNTTELSKNIISEVFRFITGLLIPCMQALVKLVVCFFIFALLLIMNPKMALVVMGVLGGLYAGLYKIMKVRMSVWGAASSAYNNQRYKMISESLSGIKEVKLRHKEAFFLAGFSVPSEQYSSLEAKNQMAPVLTRYLLEMVSFGGLLSIILYLLGTKQEVSRVIPILALYAVSGYRLMPAMQQLFGAITMARFNYPALKIIVTEVQDLHEPVSLSPVKEGLIPSIKRTLEISNLSYSYPNAEKRVLSHISFVIPVHQTIGVAGKTGAGKSTLVDLLIGFLPVSEGAIKIDGVALTENEHQQFRKNVGYVSQRPFLLDDTIAANIAFGESVSAYNWDAIYAAAESANIHSFIIGLEKGYQTSIGERGIRLSGGQQQRIAIARALYHNPEVLVFDEATSALDNETESAIMEAVHQLGGTRTIIMIAHRITTLQKCDQILILEDGRIAQVGTYQELFN